MIKQQYNTVCYFIEVGLQGLIHIGLASTILKEAKEITKCNSTLNLMDINVLKPPLKALVDAYQATRIEIANTYINYLHGLSFVAFK